MIFCARELQTNVNKIEVFLRAKRLIDLIYFDMSVLLLKICTYDAKLKILILAYLINRLKTFFYALFIKMQ